MGAEEELGAMAQMTPEEIAASKMQSAAAVNPFSSSLSAMPLWLGTKRTRKRTSQQDTDDRVKFGAAGKTRTYNYKFHGQWLEIQAPELAEGWRIEVHSDLGKRDARSADPKEISMWYEIYDAEGHSIKKVPITDPNVKARAFGKFGPQQNDLEVGYDDIAYKDELRGRGNIRMQDEQGVETDQTTTVEEELKTLYNMKPDEIKKYKTQLWLAGYYGDRDLESINMSIITNEDIQAFTSLFMQASRYHAAGKNVRWQDLLTMQAADPSAQVNANGGDEPAIVLTSDSDITKKANEMGTKILGRKPSPEDVRTIIKAIHSNERSTQEKVNAGEGGEVQQESAEATIEDFMREKYPDEAMATDWSAQAAVWESMLEGGSNAPPPVSVI